VSFATCPCDTMAWFLECEGSSTDCLQRDYGQITFWVDSYATTNGSFGLESTSSWRRTYRGALPA